jgi:hypothetical protein
MPALALVSVLLYSAAHSVAGPNDSVAKKAALRPAVKEVYCDYLCRDVIGVLNPNTKHSENYIFDKALYYYKVDTLPQVKFWRSIMNLHEDTALVSFAHSRSVVQKMSIKEWNLKSEVQKRQYRDSVKFANCLDTTSRLFITSGKKFFYDFDRTSQNFQRGINCFIQNGVDPWYSQAILLIESPNKLQKSNVGAYGPFQLMKDVARKYGLKVSRGIDERADFDRSAHAASSLLKYVCIPRAKAMLDSLKITYNEDELWFRLLVMHVYHAGAFNVQKALFACQPCSGGMDLIFSLWRTQTARFKTASQNYSQLVLAAMLEMNERNSLSVQLEAGEGVSAN